MAAGILELTDADFESKVLKSDTPVLVDFWAPWCGPCKMIGPVVAELAGEYAGRLTVAKMDIQSHPQTAARYGIRSIPALLFFKAGQVAGAIIGAQSKDKIKDKIEEIV
jgi:thioredoxin 1